MTNEYKILAYIGLPPIAVFLTAHGIELKLINGLGLVMLLDIFTAVLMWLRVDPSQLKSRVLKQVKYALPDGCQHSGNRIKFLLHFANIGIMSVTYRAVCFSQ